MMSTIEHSIIPEFEDDIYAQAVRYLCEHPEELDFALRFPGDHKIAGCLFLNAGRAPYSYLKLDHGWLANPIYIKADERYVAESESLTQMIRDDQRLPIDGECKLEHLPALMEWQRKIDRMFNRKIKLPQPVPEDGPRDDETEEGDPTEDEMGGNCQDDATAPRQGTVVQDETQGDST